MLAMPLLREGVAIGAIGIRRTEVQPFHRQADRAAETFADQAVIAIENVRLFHELKEVAWSNRRRRVKSWVSSPARRRIFSRCWMRLPKMPHGSAKQRCVHIIASTAMSFESRSVTGSRARTLSESRTLSIVARYRGRAIIDRQTIHVHDLAAEVETEFPEAGRFRRRRHSDDSWRRHCCAKVLRSERS